MNYKRFLLVLILISGIYSLKAQQISIDASNVDLDVTSGHLKMGNPGPVGKEIEANSKYLTLAGEPILPIMGEVHYSRVPREKWEETILKMKANGINIIAFYIIWIHHEETEGVFDWSGNKDVRAFVELCKKHHVWAYPRLGPWIHGEVRNGGFPDWLMEKEGMKLRTNDSAYQFYAERLYKESAEQLKGLMYKDGGPIIGIQIENEYWRGKGGEDHIMWLKNTAKKYGFDVPIYTITAWRNTSTPENEVIPLWGGYPAGPWNTDLKKITRIDAFQFIKPINDQSIGNRDENRKYVPDYSPYPYLTCELGVGNQISEHRRPVINPMDGYTISFSKVASGSNLPGYYVFTGGLNPVGKYTTLEEDQLESGYWNEYPDISYDFQAAIRETGEISEAYQHLKPWHYFLNVFGDRLAPTKPIVCAETENPDDLQCAFRTDGESGFLFVSNYYRGYQKSTKKRVQFNIQFADETLAIPVKPIDIIDSAVFVWPVNMAIGNAILEQATVQPIGKVQNGKYIDWYFEETKGIEPEYSFKCETISELKYQKKAVAADAGNFKVSVNAGISEYVEIKTKSGELHHIFTLTDKEALQLWMFKHDDKWYAYLSDANLYMDEAGNLEMFGTTKKQSVIALNTKVKPEKGSVKASSGNEAGFQKVALNYAENKVPVEIVSDDLITDVQWLKTNAKEYNAKHSLDKKLFYRELNLENTAEIRKATIYLITEQGCDIRINNRWLNQSIVTNKVNQLDLTGYLINANNRCLLKFPYAEKESAMAFAIEVEYFNADKVVFTSDTSWLCAESYKIPAVWDPLYNAAKPDTTSEPARFADLAFTPDRFLLNIDVNKVKSMSECYLRLNYLGNKARMYHAGHLVADNFNNETTWSINLPIVLKDSDELPVFEFDALPENYQIYFDYPLKGEPGVVKIKDDYIETEYKSKLEVSF